MKILICSDGSEQAEKVVRLGAALSANCQAEVALLGILEQPGETAPLMQSLQRGQALLEQKNIRAELTTKSGNPIEEIVKRTEEQKYDLVLIGAVLKEPRGRFWMSSKAYTLIKKLKPPVMVVSGKTQDIKRILVCSGGKHYIDTAVRLTGEIARCMAARVTILHVSAEPPPIFALWRRMEETVEEILNSNTELGINLRCERETLMNLSIPTEVKLRHGPVLQEILAEIRSAPYDLVVTGSTPSRHFRTYILGDISREIVNRSDRAVLVVRSAIPPATLPFSFWRAGRPAPAPR